MSETAPVAPPPQPPLLKRAFGNRTGMGFVGGTLLVATATPQPGWWGLDWLLIGGCVASAGALFRIWASGYLEKNVTVATKGPYRLVRHPLYVGSIILWIGLLLMAGNPWFAVPAGLGFYVYHAHAIRRWQQRSSERSATARLKWTLEQRPRAQRQLSGWRAWRLWLRQRRGAQVLLRAAAALAKRVAMARALREFQVAKNRRLITTRDAFQNLARLIAPIEHQIPLVPRMNR